MGVPLLKPNPPKPAETSNYTYLAWVGNEQYVFIPNWFPDGKGAWLKTLNGEVQEIERKIAKMVPENSVSP